MNIDNAEYRIFKTQNTEYLKKIEKKYLKSELQIVEKSYVYKNINYQGK